MAKKQYNTTEEFLADTSFNNWAKDNKLSDVGFWDKWIANNPDKKAIAKEAKDIILGIQFKQFRLSDEKVNSEWEILENKIKTNNNKKSKKEAPNYFKIASIAATILILFSISIYTIAIKPKKISHQTNFGEILHLKLKDGSLVTLNSNSSVHYFSNNHRKVWLSGEAFFEVDKKLATNAKFWVMTNDLKVEVYGTSFNVDTKHNKTDVFLEEGNIWLEFNNGITQKMIPGNFISYTSKGNQIIAQKEKISSDLKTSWKNGSIIFDKLPLAEAIKKIEDTYGFAAVFKDEACKAKIITGGVPTTNLDICIQAIEKSVNVRITKLKNQLIIREK